MIAESTPSPTARTQRRPSTPIPTQCATPDESEFSSEPFEREVGCHGSSCRDDSNWRTSGQEEQEDTRNNSLPSLIILHKIASYLSIGDAESVGALSRSSNITNSSVFLPGGYSLDAWCSYDGHEMMQQHGSLQDLQQQQTYQQTLSSIVDFEEEDDEGWFVGNVTQSGSLSHNTDIDLSPLEEWEPNEWRSNNNGVRRQWDHDKEKRIWTPAGEPTCEKNDCMDSTTPDLTVVSCGSHNEDDHSDDSGSEMQRLQHEHRLRKKALQHKLAQAVFAHPHPLRDYCLDAYATAVKLSQKRTKKQQLKQLNPNSETLRHPPDMSPSSRLHYCSPKSHLALDKHDHERSGALNNNNNHSAIMQNSSRQKRLSERKHKKVRIFRVLMNKLLNSIPLSVLLDLLESTFDLSMHTLFAYGKITSMSIQSIISLLSDAAFTILNSLSSINIFEIALSAHRSVNKTGEKLASGWHSVATGVGSASNAALERLSRQGLALAGAGLSRGGGGIRHGMQGKVVAVENPLESKVRLP